MLYWVLLGFTGLYSGYYWETGIIGLILGFPWFPRNWNGSEWISFWDAGGSIGEVVESTRPALHLVFYLMERIKRFRLSKESKAKAEKNRLKVRLPPLFLLEDDTRR